jgi:hypothetical protein
MRHNEQELQIKDCTIALWTDASRYPNYEEVDITVRLQFTQEVENCPHKITAHAALLARDQTPARSNVVEAELRKLEKPANTWEVVFEDVFVSSFIERKRRPGAIKLPIGDFDLYVEIENERVGKVTFCKMPIHVYTRRLWEDKLP